MKKLLSFFAGLVIAASLGGAALASGAGSSSTSQGLISDGGQLLSADEARAYLTSGPVNAAFQRRSRAGKTATLTFGADGSISGAFDGQSVSGEWSTRDDGRVRMQIGGVFGEAVSRSLITKGATTFMVKESDPSAIEAELTR